MKRPIELIGFVISILCFSCNSTVVKQPAQVHGYWSVQSAFRDKRETKLLSDVFFQFSEDGKLLTNLPNTPEGANDFELKGDQILVKSAPAMQFSVLNSTDSTLVIAMEMNNTPFEIHLKKGVPPEPEQPIEAVPEQSADTVR